jgi:hypothetical protein
MSVASARSTTRYIASATDADRGARRMAFKSRPAWLSTLQYPCSIAGSIAEDGHA